MKTEINDWTDVWHAPFWYDECGYIWDKESTMTFTIDMDIDCDNPYIKTLISDMLTILNGGESQNKYQDLTIKDGCDLYRGDMLLGYFRGWGHLTGYLDLPEEKAGTIQDRLITYVMNKLRQ